MNICKFPDCGLEVGTIGGEPVDYCDDHRYSSDLTGRIAEKEKLTFFQKCVCGSSSWLSATLDGFHVKSCSDCR